MVNPFTGMTPEIKAKDFSLSEEVFSSGLLNDAHIGAYRATSEGTILLCNNAFAEMFEYENAEGLIKSAFSIDTDMYADSGRRQNLVHMLANGGVVREYESRIKRKNTGIGWISESVYSVFGKDGEMSAYESLVIGITELVRARRDEALALDLCRAAVDAFPKSAAILRPDGNVIIANKEFEKEIGVYLGSERCIDINWIFDDSTQEDAQDFSLNGSDGEEEEFTRFLEQTIGKGLDGQAKLVSLKIPGAPFEFKATLHMVKSMDGEILGAVYSFY